MINRIRQFYFYTAILISLFCACQTEISPQKTPEKIGSESPLDNHSVNLGPKHPLVDAARKQIGVVIEYDGTYFNGGYPPNDRGVCTDVIERALRANGYLLKDAIDNDFKNHPNRYPGPFDGNMNFRRVRNLRIFFDYYAEKLSICTSDSCFKNGLWKAGDIVTYDQIPGSLWHIAIISNKYELNSQGVKIPYIIHNGGSGTREEARLLQWPAPINGHYRINQLLTAHE